MTASGDGVSFIDPEVQRCPFAHYDKVRSETAVYTDPKTGFGLLTRYADVRRCTADTREFSSKAGQIAVRDGSPVADKVRRIYETEGWAPVHSLVNNDPPDHKRFRAFVDKAFLPAHVNNSEAHIRVLAEELCNALPVGSGFDIVPAFSLPFPLRVVSHELGVPATDLERWNEWARILLEQMNPDLTPEREIELTHKVCEMQQYLAQRIAEVREHPQDNLLTHLVQAADEGHMNMGELLSVIQMLVPAGHETTANAIASGIKRLGEDLDLQDELRANPDKISAFVDEVLRLDAPIQGLYRRVLHGTEIDGCPVAKDGMIVLSWGAANRDPEKFAHPDQLNLERGNAGQHLSFGAGAHFCVGNQLARAEMRIAFETILAAFRSIELDPAIGTRTDPHFFAYGPAQLGIVLQR
jgi:cytochrome P450